MLVEKSSTTTPLSPAGKKLEWWTGVARATRNAAASVASSSAASTTRIDARADARRAAAGARPRAGSRAGAGRRARRRACSRAGPVRRARPASSAATSASGGAARRPGEALRVGGEDAVAAEPQLAGERLERDAPAGTSPFARDSSTSATAWSSGVRLRLGARCTARRPASSRTAPPRSPAASRTSAIAPPVQPRDEPARRDGVARLGQVAECGAPARLLDVRRRQPARDLQRRPRRRSRCAGRAAGPRTAAPEAPGGASSTCAVAERELAGLRLGQAGLAQALDRDGEDDAVERAELVDLAPRLAERDVRLEVACSAAPCSGRARPCGR